MATVNKAKTKAMVFENREDWLEARRMFIGGSEVAAAVGKNPWCSPHTLWLRKTGQIGDISDNERMLWGRTLEQVIGREYGRRAEAKVRWKRPGKEIVYYHPDYHYLAATLDFRQWRPDHRGMGILEIKTVSELADDHWKDGAPEYYRVQLQHQMACTGCKWGTIAGLIGVRELVWYDYDFDQTEYAQILAGLTKFWNCVCSGTPPEIDGAENTLAAIKAANTTENGYEITGTHDDEELVDSWVAAKADRKAAEERERELESRLRSRIGQASALHLSGAVVTCKTVHRKESTITYPATSYRTLRLKEQ